MAVRMTRRELVRLLSAAGLGTAFAGAIVPESRGDEGKGPAVELQPMTPTSGPHSPAVLTGGKVVQPERTLPVIDETDVLVVGGGAAGFAAAVSAARAGVKTTLVERYGYFGGLWTGGMVLLVISTHAKEGDERKKVLCGVGDELLERLTKVDGGIINQAPGKHNPTVDPEATKFVMDAMVQEAGVKVLLHCWGVDAVMEGDVIRGAVFESKAGRHAVLAKVVIDATGDGDVFAAAGAEHEQRLHAIGLVHRLGNVDRIDREKLKADGSLRGMLGGATPHPSVTWVNLRGPSTDCLDIAELTRLELAHRRSIWNRVQDIRKKPGAENVFLLDVAPQLGVRTSRLLAGTHQLTFDESRRGQAFPDVVGVGGAQGANHVGWPIPYGTLLPKRLDGLLAAGRCVCVDRKLIEDMRLIAPCLTTGHAAGAAAAVAVQMKCPPRGVDIPRVQKLLRDQGAFLG
jgi:ribulose 1,5-bisphosphate synthetase/thiazole synthase